MKYLVTGKEMQLLDKNTSEHFEIPPVVLMEQAAAVFVRELFLCLPDDRSLKRILIVCGPGNNGADGIACARLLNQQNIKTDVYLIQEQFFPEKKGSDLYQLQKKIYDHYGFPKTDTITGCYDLVVDAVFGIGLSRDVTGIYASVVEQMNSLTGRKIALDIASGIDADRGHLMGTVFRADDTFTFSFGKLGQYLWPGSEYSGKIHVLPMGITIDSALGKMPGCRSLEFSDLKDLLPERPAHSNKGTYGKVLIIAGRKNMAGAACLSARAACRSGAGLVRVLTCEENRVIVQNQVPEAILTTYTGQCPEDILQSALDWADVTVIGPGIGTDREAAGKTSYVLSHCQKILVADADALNIISGDLSLLEQCRAELVITPHLGEMSRLTKQPVHALQADLAEAAGSFARKYHLTCVLKDFRTFTAGPCGSLWINLSGNSGMASGGSGDVLTGLIAGLAAPGTRRISVTESAVCGVYLHGLAGDLIREETGEYGLCAGDLSRGLLRIWGKVAGQ